MTFKATPNEVTRRRRAVLLEYTPGHPVGYTTNLLKCAALTDERIQSNYEIECLTLSAWDYPHERHSPTLNRKDNALLCSLVDRGVNVVGFSVFSWNVIYFSRLTKILKLMAPDCKIIWGGKLATNDYKRLAPANPSVDCFCVGEGEVVFRNFLLSCLEDGMIGGPLAGTFMKIGEAYQLGSQGPLPELGNLPNPYIEGLVDPKQVPEAYIETLRGCVYSCTFCDWGGKFYRTFDDDFICAVIKACLEARFERIFFVDSIFAVQPERRKKFLKVICDNYNGHSKFGFEFFVEHLDPESIEAIRTLVAKDAISKIDIGLQSTNISTLRTIKRPHKRDRFIEKYKALVADMPSVRDRLQIDLIIGLPGETWASYGKGINTVFSLDPGIICTFPLDVFPGGEMHETQVSEYRLVFLDEPPYSIISTSTMTAFEIQKLIGLSLTFVRMRERIRKSLFFLHHLMDENIFFFMTQFAQWCEKTSRVATWFEYGDIDQHVLHVVEYLQSSDFSAPKGDAVRLERLRQLLIFELASLLCEPTTEISKALVKVLIPEGGLLNANDAPEDNRFVLQFDDLVFVDHQPLQDVVEANGMPATLLVGPSPFDASRILSPNESDQISHLIPRGRWQDVGGGRNLVKRLA